MVGLLDIGPLTKKVVVRGTEVEVRGLSAKSLFHLLQEFPEIRKLMSGGGNAPPVSGAELMAKFPDAIAKVIAAVTGNPGDAKAEAIAADLGVGEQTEVIEAAWELTFPKGVASFTEALEKIVGAKFIAPGWAAGIPSPGPSKSSSQKGTPTPGTTPPDNSKGGASSGTAAA